MTHLQKLVLGICAFLIAIYCEAQEVPKIIPPSPETASLLKFLDYPVDHSTGIPSVSIPIYEVRSGSLSLPISVSYHSSGRQVYDQNGPLGLHWSLNAGGLISRTVYGSPDFGTASVNAYSYNAAVTDIVRDFDVLAGIEHSPKVRTYGPGIYYDSEYDVFSYSVNGLSGKLIFRDSANIKIPTLIPTQPYKIEFDPFDLDYINIIDDKGILYAFAGGESYSDLTMGGIQSSWLLQKIISPDKADTISFKYTGFNQQRLTFNQECRVIDRFNVNVSTAGAPQDPPHYSESTHYGQYHCSRLQEIKFKHGRIVFNMEPVSPHVSSLMIKNIQVKSQSNRVVKTIDFNKSRLDRLADGLPPTDKLDNIVFKDKYGAPIETYSFEYYPSVPLASVINVRECDWWGYYNGNGGTVMLPNFNISVTTSFGITSIETMGHNANREPKLETMKSGVLKKVIYPTGGSSEFIYELNRCLDHNGIARDAGGLRIQQIKAINKKGTALLKTYKYGINENGVGVTELFPRQEYMITESKYVSFRVLEYDSHVEGDVPGQSNGYQSSGSYHERVLSSNIVPELASLIERPVIYPEVTEYIGTPQDNIGKSVYKYDYYLRVFQSVPSGGAGFRTPRWFIHFDNYWDNVSLEHQWDYKTMVNQGVRSYKPVRHVQNFFNKQETRQVRGLKVQRTHNVPQEGSINNHGEAVYPDKFAVGWPLNPPRTVQDAWTMEIPYQIYSFRNYYLSIGTKNTATTKETIFTDDDRSYSTLTHFTYNNRNMLYKTTRINSANETIDAISKYPFDFAGVDPYQKMIERNMIGYVIERNEFKNTTPLQSIKTAFRDWGGNVIAPEIVSSSQGTSPFEARVVYHSYNPSSKPLSVSQHQGTIISYVYGYKEQLPIAEVKNANANQIFHTSFEDINSTSVDPMLGFTGGKCWNGNYTISADKRPVSGNYIMSYWEMIGTGPWTYKAQTITNGIPQQINSTGKIDEIRVYPLTAQMTTYTYDPLVGTITATDENNRVQRYAYDSYNRLFSIRDHQGNILKQHDYHYKE